MGRQLESLTVETDTENIGVEYGYDMSGIRSSKTVVIREVEAHTHEYTSAVTAPSCTTAGYTTYTCECGESYVDNLVDALGHNYVASGNVYTCSRCGDSYAGHEHSYTESTTDPTCTEAGYTLYTCSCGDSYTVDLPALGHDYVLVNQSGTIGTYQCTRCGHTYSATIPVNPPTEEYSLRSTAATVEYHEYIYASGRLMRETITTTDAEGNDTTQILDFIYGSGNTPLALVYTNGTASPVTYYYVTNIQGDVVKMVNASGTIVASYTYDAWGRVISATGSMAEINPIRYRGYYYDSETGLYYLQSRYYDPAVKRFINADAITSTNQGFIGHNVFVYCNNAPILHIDECGYAARLVGIGAELELNVGAYVVGVEIIIYFDDEVCGGGDPIVAVYIYEGVSVSASDILKCQEYTKLIEQLTLAASTAACTEGYGKADLIALQAMLFQDLSLSVSAVGVFGYDNFDSPESYEGAFQTRTVSWNHGKVGYAYSDTGFAIVLGATTQKKLSVSIGATNYTMIALWE